MCLTPWVNGEAPSQISCLTLNSTFKLMAYGKTFVALLYILHLNTACEGNGSGLVIVDYLQHKCLLNMGTADLYGSNDPFQRMPRSPKNIDNTAALDDLIVKVMTIILYLIRCTTQLKLTSICRLFNSCFPK